MCAAHPMAPTARMSPPSPQVATNLFLTAIRNRFSPGFGRVINSAAILLLRAGRKILRKILDNVLPGISSLANGVAESAGAHAVLNVEDHVVVLVWGWAHGHGIELDLMANFPGDDMI